MSSHLPECGYMTEQPGFGGINSGIDSTQPFIPGQPCICAALRACEQRVLDAVDLPAANVQYQRVGYAAGLDAAREALEGLLHEDPCDCDTCRVITQAQAAIDALRGEEK